MPPGSPVPGYQAPPGTIVPAGRSAAVFGRLISEAHAAGELAPDPEVPPVPKVLADDASRLRDSVLPGVPDEVAIGALTAWSGIFGVVSFELFGQFNNVVTDNAACFDRAMTDLGRLIGLAA